MRSSVNKARFYRLSLLGLLSALAGIIGIFESYLPPLVVFVPQAKLGLANVVVLVTLVLLNGKSAFAVLLVKCLLSASVAGFSSLLYSLPSGLIALTAELILLKTGKISLPALSSLGGFLHASTQVFVAVALVGAGAWGYFPYLAFFGMIAGIVTGAAAYFTVRAFPESLLYKASDDKTAHE